MSYDELHGRPQTASAVLDVFRARGYDVEYHRWKLLGDCQAFVTLPNGWRFSILVAMGSASTANAWVPGWHSRRRWFDASEMEVGVLRPNGLLDETYDYQTAREVLDLANRYAAYAPGRGLRAAIQAAARALAS